MTWHYHVCVCEMFSFSFRLFSTSSNIVRKNGHSFKIQTWMFLARDPFFSIIGRFRHLNWQKCIRGHFFRWSTGAPYSCPLVTHHTNMFWDLQVYIPMDWGRAKHGIPCFLCKTSISHFWGRPEFTSLLTHRTVYVEIFSLRYFGIWFATGDGANNQKHCCFA
jgi:hypothetical protein